MARHLLLDNVTHKDLKIVTRYSGDFGHCVNHIPVFPTEYADVQREYPILFRKSRETSEYQAIALLGFTQGENLFLDKNGWNAGYIPGVIARGPFMIGFQQREDDGELRKEPVIHLDMDDPRIGETEGEPVFLSHGGNTPYLERVAGILRGIHEGMALSEAMFAAFESCGLIEPVNIQIEIHRDEHYDLRGYHTINANKLAALEGSELEKLNRAGFLQGAFLVCASLGNVNKLIEMKRKRILTQLNK
jgi:hypothetical protein